MHSILSDKRTVVHIHVSEVAFGSLVIHLIKLHVNKYYIEIFNGANLLIFIKYFLAHLN